ncbi:MAG: hypothetical protein ABIV92_07760 [Thermoflexales bacterium]
MDRPVRPKPNASPPTPPGATLAWRRRPVAGFRTSDYQRPLLKRLTPLSKLLIFLVFLGLAATTYLIVNSVVSNKTNDESLSERLARATLVGTPTLAQPVVIVPATGEGVASAAAPTVTAVPQPAITAAPVEVTIKLATAQPAFIPPPTPTVDPLGAAWQNQMLRQADGTLMAPELVVTQARIEAGAFYALLRDLPLDQYLARRDSIFAEHFAGAALQGILRIEKARKQYSMNRSGQVEIRIRDFSANGLSATALISSRGWTNDVYDISTGALIEKGRRDKDTLTVSRIMFERMSGRWKFAIINQVVEVNSP